MCVTELFLQYTYTSNLLAVGFGVGWVNAGEYEFENMCVSELFFQYTDTDPVVSLPEGGIHAGECEFKMLWIHLELCELSIRYIHLLVVRVDFLTIWAQKLASIFDIPPTFCYCLHVLRLYVLWDGYFQREKLNCLSCVQKSWLHKYCTCSINFM